MKNSAKRKTTLCKINVVPAVALGCSFFWALRHVVLFVPIRLLKKETQKKQKNGITLMTTGYIKKTNIKRKPLRKACADGFQRNLNVAK